MLSWERKEVRVCLWCNGMNQLLLNVIEDYNFWTERLRFPVTFLRPSSRHWRPHDSEIGAYSFIILCGGLFFFHYAFLFSWQVARSLSTRFCLLTDFRFACRRTCREQHGYHGLRLHNHLADEVRLLSRFAWHGEPPYLDFTEFPIYCAILFGLLVEPHFPNECVYDKHSGSGDRDPILPVEYSQKCPGGTDHIQQNGNADHQIGVPARIFRRFDQIFGQPFPAIIIARKVVVRHTRPATMPSSS